MSDAARSQETTLVRATFAEPRGRAGGGQASSTRARCGHSSGRSARFDFQPLVIPFLCRCSLALAACEKPRTATSPTVSDDFGDPVRIGHGADPDRLAQSRHHRDSLRARRRRSARRSHGLRSLARRGPTRFPTLGDGLRPNVEAVLGTRPDLVVLYASQDNRPAAARLRAAGITRCRLKIDHIADFRAHARTAGRDPRRLGARGSCRRLRLSRRSSACARATASLPRPTVVLAHLGRAAHHDRRGQLHERAGRDRRRDATSTRDITGPSTPISLEDVARSDPDFILAGPIGATKIARRSALARRPRRARRTKFSSSIRCSSRARRCGSARRRSRSRSCCTRGRVR